MNTLDVISSLAETLHDVCSFTFHEFPGQVLVQDRCAPWQERDRKMFERALELKKTGVQFWDGIMLSTFGNADYSEELLRQALHHNGHPETTVVPKETFEAWIEERGNCIDRLAFCSKVFTVSGEERHLPMLDFNIPVSDINEEVAVSVCRILELGEGWLLDSGESYHFIGEKPLKYTELEQKLYKALMFTPIIDKAWIVHQLIERSCSLRIGHKRGKMPCVVRRICVIPSCKK